MELKKLQTQIQEGGAAFDEVLQALFQKKVKTEMVIYQVRFKGRHQNFREIPYLFSLCLDPLPRLSLQPYFPFSMGKGNSLVKIGNFTPSPVYLYNVMIGNFPEILMSSLSWLEVGP